MKLRLEGPIALGAVLAALATGGAVVADAADP
jgi:hypothetical protein